MNIEIQNFEQTLYMIQPPFLSSREINLIFNTSHFFRLKSVSNHNLLSLKPQFLTVNMS